MLYLYASLPILLVLALMLFFHRGSHQAGFAGWLAGIAIAFLAFGLNFSVLWVSQVKGLLLTMNVLAVLWSALLLYHIVDKAGGVRAIANALQEMIPEPGWLLVVLAWMLSPLVENLAGFGIPIAIVAPMLILLGVIPVRAVAAVAVGHSWAVSLSGMALALRTMTDIVGMEAAEVFPTASLLLGVTVLLTGLASAWLLKQLHYWKRIVLLAVIVALAQYLVGLAGMIPLSSFFASIVGIAGGLLLSKRPPGEKVRANMTPQLKGGLVAYGILIFSLVIVSVIKPLNQWLASVRLVSQFPQVTTNNGLITAAGSGFIFKPFIHPGFWILFSAVMAAALLPRLTRGAGTNIGEALKATWHSALPATLGTLFMIGLSSLMEHTGMTMQIAEGLSLAFGSVYPLVSPLVGMLGAFATGSNTNSNILFGPMQKAVATLLAISPVLLLAAQTTGGALGSMIAPAKLAVGGSTNAMKGREGEVLRMTLPIGIGCTLIVGGLALILSKLIN
jgi:lactate permease